LNEEVPPAASAVPGSNKIKARIRAIIVDIFSSKQLCRKLKRPDQSE
jgi:hypothetical protein